MFIYNTQTRRKEEFVPREEGKVAMYACGPTVYNRIHIGNARTFLTFDVVRRYLEYAGFAVTFVQNITDLDDKIINRALEEGRPAAEVADEYTDAFIDSMHRFGIKDPDVRPRATEEIASMIFLIELLIEGGHAYEVQGDVYFSVRSLSAYGSLSGRNVDDLVSGARVEVDERKHDPLDFALWKAAKPGEPAWDSPWGQGRPGWHLECSAMAEKYLGLPLDIHGGGSDLVFPHHENEKAQAEAAWKMSFARYWMHGGMLNITGEKMSKSLGNFLLLDDVLDECDPYALRLLMLQTHYRSPLDFSYERLDEASASYDRLCTAVKNLRWAADNADAAGGSQVEPGADSVGRAAGDFAGDALEASCEEARQAYKASMDDDFNTAGALGAVFSLVAAANSFLEENPVLDLRGRDLASQVADLIEELVGVLGIQIAHSSEWPIEACELAKEFADYDGNDAHEAIDVLMARREQARSDRDWSCADGIRDRLTELGFVIEDTANGARVSYGR